MFTGLIETIGVVTGRTAVDAGARVRIGAALASELRAGDSIAVNGVCLTATTCDEAAFQAEVGPETMRITTLGSLAAGQRVNLERPMPADGRFGGHFVQGHADGTGVVEDIRDEGESHWIAIRFPLELEPFFIPKGSVAADGVSLTIARLERTRFHVMIIPFTWEHTTLSSLRAGDRVNLECDMLGKYVARSLELAARVST